MLLFVCLFVCFVIVVVFGLGFLSPTVCIRYVLNLVELICYCIKMSKQYIYIYTHTHTPYFNTVLHLVTMYILSLM